MEKTLYVKETTGVRVLGWKVERIVIGGVVKGLQGRVGEARPDHMA